MPSAAAWSRAQSSLRQYAFELRLEAAAKGGTPSMLAGALSAYQASGAETSTRLTPLALRLSR